MGKRIVVLLPVLFESSVQGSRARAVFKEFEDKYGAEYELVFGNAEDIETGYMEDAVAIIGNPRPEQLLECRRLEWLQLDFAGTDRYMAAIKALDRDIRFTNASGAFGRVISEHMLAQLMALYRRIPEYVRNQADRQWQDMGPEKSVFSKNILVLGTGDIGSAFAGIMKHFDARITGINRRGRQAAGFDHIDTVDNLKQYVPMADIIACCVPRNATTDNLISRDIIAMMNKDAVIINVGRGNCIDQNALCEALNKNQIRGAALDVFVNEPLDKNDDIWNTKTLLITPHVAGKTYGHLESTVEAIVDICIKNLYRYVEGKELINLVDKETGYRIETT